MLTSKSTGKKKAQPVQQPTAAQMASGLIISVNEARKLLGVEAKGLSDDQVASLVLDMEELARELLNTSNLSNKPL